MAISVSQGDVIKVVSFNLRRDFGPQRKNRWESRKELAARMIAESDAAIIGVQEFLPKMRQDLKTLLDGYSIFGKGRLSGKDPGSGKLYDILALQASRCSKPSLFCGLSKNLHRCRGEDQKEWKTPAGIQHPF